VCVAMQENIVEYKHHKLARSLRSGPTDRDLKPNAATRDQLNVMTMVLSCYSVMRLGFICMCLQCFDAVGLEAGRSSGL